MTRSNANIGNTGYGNVGVFVNAWEISNNGTTSTIRVQGGIYYDASAGSVSASTRAISLSGRGEVDSPYTIQAGYDEVLDSYDTVVSHSGNGDAVNASFACYGHSTFPKGDATASVTIATSANPRYTISYDGNGAGGNVPGNQTKVYGFTSYTSNTVPWRTGYSFSYWHGSDGGTYYPGNAINTDGNITLTAVWQIITYSISFNANGGSNVPGTGYKNYGSTYTIPSTVPTRNLYNFVSYSGSDSGTYQPGGSFTGNYNLTLTANWKLAYIRPTIDNLVAYHCDSTGTASDSGKYVKATVVWHIDTSVYSDNQGSGINVTCNGATTNKTISGTSGTTEIIVGEGTLNQDTTYYIDVLVYDTKMGTSYGASRTTTAPGAIYAINASPGQHVGIYGAAEDQYIFCVKNSQGVVVFAVNESGYFKP